MDGMRLGAGTVRAGKVRGMVYALFALAVVLMSWESSLASAAIVPHTIPEESIRIRILANSDSVEDQWIKKEIQGAVIESVNSWMGAYETIDEARAQIARHIPELERVVGELLEQYGFSYGGKVELGLVEFPAKVFEGETYPAGQYEALRITLGRGDGQNWWCVMFPPLCFGKGTVKVGEAAREASAGVTGSQDKQDSGARLEKKLSDNLDRAGNISGGEQSEEKVEYRFFLVEVIRKVKTSVAKWFS